MIGRTLYGLKKQALYWVLDVEEDFSGVPRKKCMLKRVFDVDGKDAPSFCFGAVFRTIRKDLFISRKQRPQKRKERLKLS